MQKFYFLTLLYFFNSILFAQPVINEYTSDRIKLFATGFESEEGNGGLIDSSVNNNGDIQGNVKYIWSWGTQPSYNPEVYDGEYYFGTAITNEDNGRVHAGYNYNLYTPWFSGKKLKVEYYSYMSVNGNQGSYRARFLMDRKSTPHTPLRAEDSHTYDGQLYENWSSHDWQKHTYDTNVDGNASVSDSTRFVWHLDVNNNDNNLKGWYMDSLAIWEYKRVIEHEEHANTTNPGGPYRINASLNDSITWLQDPKLYYSTDGNSYTNVTMNETSDYEYYYDLPGQAFGTTISYYISCMNNVGVTHVSKESDTLDYQFNVVDNGNGYNFAKVQPVNFSEDVDIYTVMGWEDIGDPYAVYTIQYGTDIDFTPGSYTEKSVMESELYNPVDFIKDEVYYWRVYSVNTLSGDTVWADGGEKWVFEIVPPSIPSILNAALGIPANRTIIPENNPYQLRGTVENLENDTLTIRPGVEVWWGGPIGNGSLDINGLIVIEGTADNRITFRGHPEYENRSGIIGLNNTSPQLVITSDFVYQSGPKISYAEFYDGGFFDNGWTGAYVEYTNAYEQSINIAYGVIDSCILGGGGGSGLNAARDTIYAPFLIQDSQFTGNLSTSNADSLIIRNSLFEFASINATGSYPAYISNITVNNGSSNFGANDDGNHYGTNHEYLKITNADYLEPTGWAILTFDRINVDIDSVLIYDGVGGIDIEPGDTVRINNTTINQCENEGIRSRTYSARHYVEIKNSTITQNNDHGINFSIETSDTTEINISDNIITSNTLMGITLSGGRGNVNNNTINGNGYGVYVNGSHHTNFRGNDIIGNAPGGAFYSNGGSNIHLTNNVVRNNANNHTSDEHGNTLTNGWFKAGIVLQNINGCVIDSNHIDNNNYHVFNFDNSDYNNSGYDFIHKMFAPVSITTTGSETVRIKGNIISNNHTWSDYLDDSDGNDQKYRFSFSTEYFNLIGGGIAVLGYNGGVEIRSNIIESNAMELYTKFNQWRNWRTSVYPAMITWGLMDDTVRVKSNTISNNTFRWRGDWDGSYEHDIYALGIGPLMTGNYNMGTYNYVMEIDSNLVENNTLTEYSRRNTHYYAVGMSLRNEGDDRLFTKIRENTIRGNRLEMSDDAETEEYYAVGTYIWANNDSVLFSDNHVVGNIDAGGFDEGYAGGYYGNVSVKNSTFSQNQGRRAGGLYFNEVASHNISGCTITLNTATNENGVGAVFRPGSLVKNSIIVGNRVLYNGQIMEEEIGGISAYGYASDLHYNNLYNNSGYDFYNHSSNDIDGTYNWWNSRSEQILINDEIYDGIDNDGATGLVTYQPFLTFASDSTPGQIVTYDSLSLFSDNTFQVELSGQVKRGRRFFIQLVVQDGNENSVDQTAVKIKNLRNGDYIAPVATETELNTGVFHTSAVAGLTTTFVWDSLRTIHGDSLEISPYNYPSMKMYLTVDTTDVDVLMGDANGDGSVDVLDVMNIVGYILFNQDSLDYYAADVNFDSYINILDVIGVINIVVGNSTGRIVVDGDISIENPKNIKTSGDKAFIPIRIKNVNGLAGLQLEFHRKNGDFQISDILVDGISGGEYQKVMTDSSVFIIAYSLTGSPLSDNGIEILVTLNMGDQANGNLELGSMVAADFVGNPIAINVENLNTRITVVPDRFDVSNAYPNPFNPTTKIKMDIPDDGLLTAVVYDINGRFVNYLVNSQYYDAGYHIVSWNSQNYKGTSASNGLYLIRFIYKNHTKIRKIILLK
jgi:hypothetical protein